MSVISQFFKNAFGGRGKAVQHEGCVLFFFFFSGYRVLLLRVHDKAGLPEPLPFLRALEMETCGGREILSVVEERGGAGLPSS